MKSLLWCTRRHRLCPSLFRLASLFPCLCFARFSFFSLHERCFGRQQSFVKVPPKSRQKIPQVEMAVNEHQSCRRGPPYTVFIEGNVGSGKTTFLEHFSDCPNVFLAREPVHKWQDVRGHNFLVRVLISLLPLTV